MTWSWEIIGLIIGAIILLGGLFDGFGLLKRFFGEGEDKNDGAKK